MCIARCCFLQCIEWPEGPKSLEKTIVSHFFEKLTKIQQLFEMTNLGKGTSEVKNFKIKKIGSQA